MACDDNDAKSIEEQWRRFGFDIPLEIVTSPYRELVGPVERYLDDLDQRWANDTMTVVIPEFLVGLRSLANTLHGQSALALKIALLDRPRAVVTSVPFHIGSDDRTGTAGANDVAPAGVTVGRGDRDP